MGKRKNYTNGRNPSISYGESFSIRHTNTESCAGYSDVSYEDVWNLDMRLADIIAKHLRAFLKTEKGPNGGCPASMSESCGLDAGSRKWLNTIRKMIYAFEEYSRSRYTNEYMDMEETKRKRIKEGMQLFVDHFHHLWI